MFKNRRNKKLYTFMDPKSAAAESFRILRTNITFSIKDRQNKTILFTSADFDGGKSMVTANLGVVMAQTGSRVLIVDTDLRSPMIHRFFDSDNSNGLSDLLKKNLRIIDTVRDTGIKGLSYIPGGAIPSNPAELLETRNMKEFLEEAAELYDIILLDAPPVMAVSDVSVLLPLIEGVVMVVKSGFTKIDRVIQVKKHLEKFNAKIIGVVLNEFKIDRNDLKDYYEKHRQVEKVNNKEMQVVFNN